MKTIPIISRVALILCGLAYVVMIVGSFIQTGGGAGWLLILSLFLTVPLITVMLLCIFLGKGRNPAQVVSKVFSVLLGLWSIVLIVEDVLMTLGI